MMHAIRPVQFYHPSGLGAYVNASLDDVSFFMYIADRDNHVIRGMSAICSFGCENGGHCVGPDRCQCEEGWGGPDCTKPVCQISCGQRELCVAPDTCDCIPGYRGESCLEATCAQKCENGHCSTPDVCACLPGWFDSNCVSSNCAHVLDFVCICTNPLLYDASYRPHLYVNKHAEMGVSLQLCDALISELRILHNKHDDPTFR